MGAIISLGNFAISDWNSDNILGLIIKKTCVWKRCDNENKKTQALRLVLSVMSFSQKGSVTMPNFYYSEQFTFYMIILYQLLRINLKRAGQRLKIRKTF